MTNTLQVEQVRADQIREGDAVWERADFRPVVSVYWEGDWLTIRFDHGQMGLHKTRVVLRQATPVSPEITEETFMRAGMEYVIGAMLANDHPIPSNGFSITGMRRALEYALTSQEKVPIDAEHEEMLDLLEEARDVLQEGYKNAPVLEQQIEALLRKHKRLSTEEGL